MISSHRALAAQVSTLVSAWEWQASDHILHFLPLHHVHGVVNKLCCGLWAGATVDFVPFEPKDIWRRFANRQAGTVFMAVPTIYAKVLGGREGGVWNAGACDDEGGRPRAACVLACTGFLPSPERFFRCCLRCCCLTRWQLCETYEAEKDAAAKEAMTAGAAQVRPAVRNELGLHVP